MFKCVFVGSQEDQAGNCNVTQRQLQAKGLYNYFTPRLSNFLYNVR